MDETYARHLICQLVAALEYLHFEKVRPWVEVGCRCRVGVGWVKGG